MDFFADVEPKEIIYCGPMIKPITADEEGVYCSNCLRQITWKIKKACITRVKCPICGAETELLKRWRN